MTRREAEHLHTGDLVAWRFNDGTWTHEYDARVVLPARKDQPRVQIQISKHLRISKNDTGNRWVTPRELMTR